MGAWSFAGKAGKPTRAAFLLCASRVCCSWLPFRPIQRYAAHFPCETNLRRDHPIHPGPVDILAQSICFSQIANGLCSGWRRLR
jgi:hypothetical protein